MTGACLIVNAGIWNYLFCHGSTCSCYNTLCRTGFFAIKSMLGFLVWQIWSDKHDYRYANRADETTLFLFWVWGPPVFGCGVLWFFCWCFAVFEMVQCAVEYGSPCEPDHITFGEFSILVTELQNYYSKK